MESLACLRPCSVGEGGHSTRQFPLWTQQVSPSLHSSQWNVPGSEAGASKAPSVSFTLGDVMTRCRDGKLISCTEQESLRRHVEQTTCQ